MKLLRTVACLATGIALATLTACNSGSNSGRTKVAFISNNPYEFWTYARKGTEQAAKDFDVDVEFYMPPLGKAEEQRQAIEDFLAKGIQGIAISPNDAANQAEFLNGVADQIPLITQDSDLPAGSKRLCYIGTNNYDAGKAVGKLVKEAVPDGGKIVIYVGKLDVQNAVERRQGVLDELAGERDAHKEQLEKSEYPIKFGKYTLLDTMTDDAKEEKCKANVEATLAKESDVRCLIGLWAYNPPAMLSAVRDAIKIGKVRKGQIALVGFDENQETLQGIEDGMILATVVQQPYKFGYEAVHLLSQLAKGDRSGLPKNGILYIPHRVIKKDNVENFRAELQKLRS
ncbi:MAG TPA: sugar-binding protein [Gemmataceae bacterium]|jgi:ribose transport system substrate-binding protein|nr:sugar-binding protein [Gemmataceae bacterium]